MVYNGIGIQMVYNEQCEIIKMYNGLQKCLITPENNSKPHNLFLAVINSPNTLIWLYMDMACNSCQTQVFKFACPFMISATQQKEKKFKWSVKTRTTNTDSYLSLSLWKCQKVNFKVRLINKEVGS